MVSVAHHVRVPRESERVPGEEPVKQTTEQTTEQTTKQTTEQTAKLTAEEALKARLKTLLEDCDSRSLGKFLDVIQQTPGELGPQQLDIVFDLMNQLIVELNLKKAMHTDDSLLLLQRSPVFTKILDRSLALLDQLNSDALLNFFETLILTRRGPESAMVSQVLHALTNLLDEMHLGQLCKCYKTADQYRLLNVPETQQVIRLKREVLRREKDKLLRHRFYPSEGDTIVDHFANFADFENDPDFAVVERLARVLLIPTFSKLMTFEQALDILTKTQSSYNLYRSRSSERPAREKRLYPPILSELFEKCNTRIFEEFTLNPSSKMFSHFLQTLHSNVSPVNFEFPNFYDERLLSLIRPWIIWSHQHQQELNHSLVLRMLRNYAQFYIFDEQLLKLVYEQACSKRAFRRSDATSLYWLLAKFRWPFVDHQNSDLLIRVYNSIESSSNYVRLLTCLLLNDVSNSEVLGHLNVMIDLHDETTYRDLRMDDYRMIALAKNYLSLFGRLPDDLKSELEFKLQRILQHLQAIRLQAKGRYIHFDQRLTNVTYLSNGLFVDAFAIYDRSVGDLVSLHEHTDSTGNNFSKVDLLPITKQQERWVTVSLIEVRSQRSFTMRNIRMLISSLPLFTGSLL